MGRLLIEVSIVLLFWIGVGAVVVRAIVISARKRKAIEDREHDEQLKLAAERERQRPSAAWQAEYDDVKERLAREADE